MQLLQNQIKNLCDSWKQSALNGGGLTIGPSEQFRLMKNGISFHELQYDELRTAYVELTKILLLPGMSTIIDQDHTWIWSWSAEVLLGHKGPFSLSVNRDMNTLCALVTHAALAQANPPTREGFERRKSANSLLNPFAREFLSNSHIALSYLCFPFLEAVSRQACNSYVDPGGTVLQPFARSNGSSYAIGSRCSNVGDLLRLLLANVASPGLKSDLTEALNHVAQIGGQPDGCSVVFNWRNPSLHGEATFNTIGGTIYSLALLIALDGVSLDYEKLKKDAVQRFQQELAAGQLANGNAPRSHWSYYPPYY
jgi:hypothetical protein